MRINRKKSNSGFTLLELVVVIAIISILAAFLFPLFASTRQRANQSISLNNLKQWGVALNRSLGDNNGLMPSDGQGSTSIKLNDLNAWFNRLPPYIDEKPLSDPFYATNPPKPGDRSVWINPAVPKDDGMKYIKPPQQFLFCYAMNYFLSNSKEPTQPISRIERPSATVFMAEKNDEFANCNPKYIKAYFGAGDPAYDKNNAAHFLFCDGHVDLIKRANFDPNLITVNSEEEPNPINNKFLNKNFTFVPYVGATSS